MGRQRRGAQKMALDPGCMQHGILLHEFGHVIGFWHEQNRPDRDEYIEVIKNYHVRDNCIVCIILCILFVMCIMCILCILRILYTVYTVQYCVYPSSCILY